MSYREKGASEGGLAVPFPEVLTPVLQECDFRTTLNA